MSKIFLVTFFALQNAIKSPEKVPKSALMQNKKPYKTFYLNYQHA